MTKGVFISKRIQIKMEESETFRDEFYTLVGKYFIRDWGDTCESDKKLNDDAIKTKDRIVALYKTSEGKVFGITEYGHEITTFIFADEY